MTGPVCQSAFTPRGRQRSCGAAGKAAASCRRLGLRVALGLPPRQPRRPLAVYECPSCGSRAVEAQRGEAGGTFRSRVGYGGVGRHGDDPVAVADRMPPTVWREPSR